MILYCDMIWLSNSTIIKLRDQLRDRGRRPSVAMEEPGEADTKLMLAEFSPLCEAMYLMMSSDGDITGDEREVLKGAMRNLSEDRLRGNHIETMLEGAKTRASEQGRDRRLVDVAHSLKEDPAKAEVAFVLAAAIAFADNAIADEENELLNGLAENLGIDEDRANRLLDEVEKDMGVAQGG
jgi:tellurite resistance protein